jgi:preprotein translocase subunit SecD
VIAELPTADGAGIEQSASREALASCDVDAVLALGESAATTTAKRAKPDECVLLTAKEGLLTTEDGSGTRYLLGPSVLDATDVKKVKPRFDQGNGWSLQLSLTRAGARALDALGEQQFHDRVALVADGMVVVAPMIQPGNTTFESFDGTMVTSGLTRRGATDLATSIAKWRKSG